MSRSRAMESTPADGTRARARSNRAESSSSIEELGDATVVTRAQVHTETASRAESEVDRTMAILPHPTPPPAHRTLERATAQPTPPNPPPAETEVGALLAAFRQLQATVLVESRTLAQRVARLEQGQSGPSTVATAPRGVDSAHRDRAPHARKSRRDSDSSESSQPEQAPRVSPRKRVPQPIANPIPRSRSPLRRCRSRRARLISRPPLAYNRSRPLVPARDAYSYPFLEKLRVAEPPPTAQRTPERVTEPAAQFAVTAHSQEAGALDWDAADRETLLKAASRPRFIESSGVKIRSFLADAELFLTLCNRPRSRWAYFVFRGSAAKKPRKFDARMSPTRSPTTRNFATALQRSSAVSSSRAPSAPNCAR